MTKSNNLWHSLAIDKIFKELDSSEKGLHSKQVEKLLLKHGENRLATKAKFSLWKLFLSQFKSALVYVLLVAGLVSVFFGEKIDVFVIMAAVTLNVVIGFIQEYKANQSLEKLNQVVKQETLVIRDGIESKIETKSLVPGDVIVLESGNRIPADARLIYCNDFQINEATLTGESWPVKKSDEVLDVGTVLAERSNMVFMGTLVVEGRAKAVIVNTGLDTEMGKITSMLKDTEEEKTPLQIRLDEFAKFITKVVAFMSFLIFIIGLLEGHEWTEMFTVAVAVAVSAIPEGLVISMTMILTVGMQRILKKKGLVRRLISAETLGSTTIICTDKTGTLTEGLMAVTQFFTNKYYVDLSSQSFRDIASDKETDMFLKLSLLCNDSVIQNPKDPRNEWTIIGSPTEKALLDFSLNLLDYESSKVKYARLAEIPFDSHRKFMVTRHTYNDKYDIIFIKGAPEKILLYSDKYLTDKDTPKMTTSRKKQFSDQWQNLSKNGLRVLAGAYQLVSKDFDNFDNFKGKNKGFIFVGAWGLNDPLRPSIKDTLEQTKNAGLNTVMITGDNKFTATKIAEDLGMLINEHSVVTGDELLKMDDKELARRVRHIKVYARVSPADKLRIIKAWQSKGEIVSMTGDGVNDAPALKAADIGVAVSSGSDVAKETADLVLLDNNFNTIVMAIKEGRVIFANIRKVALYLLSDGLSEVIIIIGGLLLNMPLPLLTAQILWVNLVDDGFPALALTMEPEEDEIMNKKPKKSRDLLDLEGKAIIFLISAITGGLSLWIFFMFWDNTGNLDLARTVTFTFLALSTLFYVFSIKSLDKSIFKINPFKNKYLNASVLLGIFMQLIAIYLPVFNNLLRTVPLGWKEWEIIFAFILLVIICIEIFKAIFMYYHKKYNK